MKCYVAIMKCLLAVFHQRELHILLTGLFKEAIRLAFAVYLEIFLLYFSFCNITENVVYIKKVTGGASGKGTFVPNLKFSYAFPFLCATATVFRIVSFCVGPGSEAVFEFRRAFYNDKTLQKWCCAYRICDAVKWSAIFMYISHHNSEHAGY
jgi:hypothetical protein